MKLSWKIFISTFVMVLLALCVGEIMIISTSFKKSLENEVEQIKSESIMMRIEIATLVGNYNKSMYRNEREALKSVLQTLSMSWKLENREFRIADTNEKVIIENMNLSKIIKLNKMPQHEEKLNYKIYHIDNSYYLQACTRLKLEEKDIFIINVRNISEIFSKRNDFLASAFSISLIIGGACAVVNWIIILWILKPLSEMASAMNKIKEGNLSIQVKEQRKDELGILSNCFNAMTISMRRNIQELKEAARRQEDFVGSFTHEIKTPLTSIIGYADLIRTRKLDEEATYMASNYIYGEGKRLEDLSIKLLGLIVEKNTQISRKRITIEKLIHDAVEILRPSLDKKQIQVILNICVFDINVDEALMKTVIINLIDNARKAVGINGWIKIITSRDCGKISIDIIDNGRGIPEEDMDKIMEAFYMVDKSRARQEGGAGLGLSICEQIIRLHNGEMILESKLNVGTKVSIYLAEDIYEEIH